MSGGAETAANGCCSAGVDYSADEWRGRELATDSSLEQAMYSLIDNKMSKSSQNPLTRALHAAVEVNDVAPVEKLIQEGADLRAYVHGWTPLGKAAQRGNLGVVRALLGDRAVAVDQLDFYERTALMYASEHGHRDVVDALIERGCSLDMGDGDNATALHLSSCQGHEDIVAVLLKAGSNPRAKTSYTSERLTPLHCACGRGFTGIAKKLLKYGAKVDSLDYSKKTPLHVAAIRGHHEVVELLIEHGANINLAYTKDHTPLFEAVWQNDMEMVRMLLQGGAETRHCALVHNAISHRNIELVDMLVKAGCHVDQLDCSGDTPMHAAVRHSIIPIVENLVDYGCDVNIGSDYSGATPLHVTVRIDMEFPVFQKILNILIKAGAKLDVESCEAGKTPLYTAIMQKKAAVARELIRRGAEVNRVQQRSRNYLHTAWYSGQPQIVRALVTAGYSLQDEQWLFVQDLADLTADELDTLLWLQRQKHNARPLANLCAIALRRTLYGGDLYVKVEALPLPRRLKESVQMRDL